MKKRLDIRKKVAKENYLQIKSNSIVLLANKVEPQKNQFSDKAVSPFNVTHEESSFDQQIRIRSVNKIEGDSSVVSPN